MKRSIGPKALTLAALALFLATGGFGLLAPSIDRLVTECSDYVFTQVAVCLLISVPLAFLSLLCWRSRSTSRLATAAALAGPVFVASVVLNLALGQDPLLARLNWLAPTFEYGEHGHMIENHEWIDHDPARDRYHAGRGA